MTHRLVIAPRFGSKSRALIVDGHATTRSILASHLRALGVGQIVQCSRAQESVRQFESLGFDVVLCEHRLADGTLGQEFIDELRRRSLMSLRTVVMMISAECSYDVVAQVAESAVDGFLIKPYSPGQLEDRLMRAFLRKDSLRDVYDAIDGADHALALGLCEARYARRERHWIQAARLGAELALRLDRAALASTLYEAVLSAKAVPWAKLGIARALDAGGRRNEAVSTIESLLASEPTYVDAYDVLGKLHAEQGNVQAAVTAYRQACEITPASVMRAQRYGIVAYYAGDAEVALQALERAAALGANSIHFDHQTVLLLALARHRKGDADGVRACVELLDGASAEAAAAAAPPAGTEPVADDAAAAANQSRALRLTRLAQIVHALDTTLQGDGQKALSQVALLAEGLQQADFDVEAAANLLALLAKLRAAGVQMRHDAGWLRSAGLRFCISRNATEMLIQACDADPVYAEHLRNAQAEIGEIAQTALGQALAGHHRQAVEHLLDHVERTRNIKLLNTATATLARHADRIGDGAEAAALQSRCDAMKRHCGLGGRTSLLADAAERPPGALASVASRGARGTAPAGRRPAAAGAIAAAG